MSRKFWLSPLAKLAIALITISSVVNGTNISGLLVSELQPIGTYLPGNDPINHALASSGGRMSGGSFDSAPSSSGSSGRSSDSYSSDSYSSDSYSSDYSSSTRSNTDGDPLSPEGITLLLFIGLLLMPQRMRDCLSRLMTNYFQGWRQPENTAQKQSSNYSYPNRSSRQVLNELNNDVVTVTQVQVAMLAQARDVQQTLNQTAINADLNTKEGLVEMLQETVLALLRSPYTWTHVYAHSKTVNTRQDAKQYFEALSIEERSKFDVESLVNVSGRVRQQKIIRRDDDPADYIVVTLIVGTADDRPLLGKIISADELQMALKQLGAIPPEYLMVCEVLWSPQGESDSLTDEELLLNYPNMIQIR